jgi:amino acid adenylation domain-containing protein/FkbH-like protein/FkbM family methyltransferase
MQLHHLGYACENIKDAIKQLKASYDILSVSPIIFDELQNATVCILELADHSRIELVSGKAVENFLSQQISLYHICYEVINLEATIEQFRQQGHLPLSEPKPAKLFDNKRVVFIQTELGLIELLETSHSHGLPVVINGTFNLEPIMPLLQKLQTMMGLHFKFNLTGYNQMFQELLNPTSAMRSNTQGGNLLFINFADWFHYSSQFNDLELKNNLNDFIESVIQAARSIKLWLIICPINPTLPQEQIDLLENAKSQLQSAIIQQKNITWVEMADSLEIYAIKDYMDVVTNRIGHIPYTDSFYAALALTSMKQLVGSLSQPIKLIVVDCDNTLWQGACAELGTEGIQITPAHLMLQKKLINMHDAGIIICLCSKNELNDVMNVFEQRKDMLLQLKHLVSWKINWDSKDQNIRLLSEKLNIRPENILFLDDNPVECAQVKSALPDVTVITIPQTDEQLKKFCELFWIFNATAKTQEDTTRHHLYRAHLQREELRDQSFSLSDFIKSLNLQITIEAMTEESIDRIAQLSERTNQFNLTAEIVSIEKLRQLTNDNRHCLQVHVRDRFGDYGMVGVMIYSLHHAVLRVETFLLSCRVLGRGIELSMLQHLGLIAEKATISVLEIAFCQSKRNEPAKRFLDNLPNTNQFVENERRYYQIKTETLANLAPFQHSSSQDKPIPNTSTYHPINRQLAAEMWLQPNELLSIMQPKAAPLTQNKTDAIITIWQEILGKKDISVNDDYLALGGDSLKAVRIISRIYQTLDVELKIGDFFKLTTPASLASHIEKNQQTMLVDNTVTLTTPAQTDYPLSFSQQWLWLLDQLLESSWFYNMPVALRLRGMLNVRALEYAFQQVLERHTILRTKIIENNSFPRSFPLTQPMKQLTFMDLPHLTDHQLQEYYRNEARKPFNLATGPLLRANLIKITPDEFILFLTAHHIIFDGWSYDIFYRELSYYYNNYLNGITDTLPSLTHTFFDFAHWQHSYKKTDKYKKNLAFWKNELAEIEPFDVTPDYSRKLENNHQGEYLAFNLGEILTEQTKQFCQATSVSQYALLMAVFALQIARRCRQHNIVILSPTAGREQIEFENTIGCFVNLLVFNLKINPQNKLLDFIKYVFDKSLACFEHHQTAFTDLMTDILKSHALEKSSAFQIMFSWQNMACQLPSFTSVKTDYFTHGYPAARVELILELEERGSDIAGGFYYNSSLYRPETIETLVAEFKQVLSMVVADANLPLHHLLPQTSLLHQVFEKNAAEKPHATALIYQQERLSYRDLNAKSNQLAWFLMHQYKVEPGDHIVICIPNSFELIIAIIAAMKLGVTYVPISGNGVNHYTDQILQQVMPKAVLVNNKVASQFSEKDYSIINIDILNLSLLQTENINRYFPGNTIAYIIFTSGSTGKPKGVMVKHESLIHVFKATETQYQFSSADKIIFACSYTFDFSVWEMWVALAFGGQLIIPHFQVGENLLELFNLIHSANITVFNQTPLVIQQYLTYVKTLSAPPNNILRLLILGGDTLQPSTLHDWFDFFPRCNIYNMYGITEVTIHATSQHITPDVCRQTKSLIGKALPGYELLLIDENNNVVTEPGVIGEIYIGGAGLASGYFKDPDLTIKKFCYPLKKQPDKRLFKSGDQARYTNVGNIEFIGRNEQQAKLRGYRINLPGINNLLHSHPGVYTSQLQINAQDNLVAYIVPDSNTANHILNAVKTTSHSNMQTMPNGLTFYYYNKSELNYLYNEIFVNEDYLKFGIELEPGQCVVDVGANIGLFSIHLANCVQNLQFYAFEPAEEVFAILQANMHLHQLNMICMKAGLANENAQRNFTFYRDMSLMSGLYADAEQDSTAITVNLRHTAADLPISTKHLKNYANSLLEPSTRTCEMKTLSSVIAKNNIKQIDLLKLDVEKSELDILTGIEPNDWKIIRQIVIELHDQGGTLSIIKNLLQQNGFYFRITQESHLAGSQIYKIFATRNPNAVNQASSLKVKSLQQWQHAEQLTQSIKQFLSANLPDYMVPSQFHYLEKIPLNQNGKFALPTTKKVTPENSEKPAISSAIVKIWQEVLGLTNISLNQNFFDLGGNSLLMFSAYVKLEELFPGQLSLVDLFKYTTITDLEKYILKKCSLQNIDSTNQPINDLSASASDIAIIGMAGCFPGANDLDRYWHNLENGLDTIYRFPIPSAAKKNFVPASGLIDDIDLFDAEFFTISPKEAAMMDPQHRVFLMLCYQALQASGYTTDKFTGRVGIYAGMGNSHYLDYLNSHHPHLAEDNHIQLEICNEKDYLATRVANKLGLTGSVLNINTACSTSLVSIVKACQSLASGENDIMLAGGISLLLPERAGYTHKSENILSSDGFCRPFSANSNGTVLSSGAGVVVLKRLSDALRDNDEIHAVIKGYATNNDGSKKVGFAAPSAVGQTECIQQALKVANVSPRNISYVEAHGTGTRLGDPIEIEALTEVYHQHSNHAGYCAIGSVKGNIGHADAAAGIAGLLKIMLMLQNNKIPPSLHFQNANPHIHFENSPFYVNTHLKDWKTNANGKHLAAVSSFGIGGSNAHIIIESSPVRPKNVKPLHRFKMKRYWYDSPYLSDGNKNNILLGKKSINEIANIVENCLGVSSINFDVNFHDLGGTSMQFLELVDTIEKHYQFNITLDMLANNATVNKLYQLVNKTPNEAIKAELVLLKSGTLGPIILLHPTNGALFQYQHLLAKLAPEYAIYGIKNEVHLMKLESVLSIKELATHYCHLIKNLTGSPILLGWSYGGALAFEMAHQLEQQGLGVKAVVMIDSWAKYDDRLKQRDYYQRIFESRYEQLAGNHWSNNIWQRVQALLTYKPKSIQCPLFLFKAGDLFDEYQQIEDANNHWLPHTKSLETFIVNANHETIMQTPTVSLVTDVINKKLEFLSL